MVFLNEDYEPSIFFHDVTNKISLRDSKVIVDVAMGQKFGNSSISGTEVIIISVLSGLFHEKHLF